MKLQEQYVVFVNVTYLDKEKSSRGKQYFGDIFLHYPSQEEIEEIIQRFIEMKEEGKINAESINFVRVEKRYKVYESWRDIRRNEHE